MLAILASLGATPAAMLSPRFDAVSRVGLAPVLGLCVGTSLFTTLAYPFAANDTAWLVPVACVASLAGAVRIGGGRSALRAAAAGHRLAWASLALVAVVVAGPLVYTMHQRHTVGPASYAVWDADGYVAATDVAASTSLHDEERALPPWHNLEVELADFLARGDQNLDATRFSANVNALVGLGATDTWEAFLVAFLLAGGLGATAALRYGLQLAGAPRGRPSWRPHVITGASTVGGCLFAGAFFLQLAFDGSQAALCGLAVLLPLAAVGADAIRRPRIPTLIVLAILYAGEIALYPLFAPPVVGATAVVLAVLAARDLRARGWQRERALRAVGMLALVIVVAIVLDLVAFLRDVRYWESVLSGAQSFAGLPVYHLGIDVIPGWLLQTREFYNLTNLAGAPTNQIILALVVPALLAVVIAAGLRRFAILRWLLVLAAVSVLLALYTALHNGCSYCTDRNLLTLGPVLAALVAGGIGALLLSGRRSVQVGGVLALLLVVVFVGQRARVERVRFLNSSYFLDSANRSVLSRLPANDGSVEIEGFDESPRFAPGEETQVYALAEERSGGRATLPGDVSDNAAMAYLGQYTLDQGQFDPNYRYVLTRMPSVVTSRRVIAFSGGIALEQRTQPLDVIVDSGFDLPSALLDPAGQTWATAEPLRFIVSGGTRAPVYVGVRFLASEPVAVPPQPGVAASLVHRDLRVCVRATGTAPVRVAQFSITFTGAPSPVADEEFAPPPVIVGEQLVALEVAEGHCPYSLGRSR